ncbi:MAG: DUF2220 family protein [Coriobacteriales bacterium]|jgi:hypothetical protein|nr:DUF2220 family protein [Coriobacteriales bacterium]
MISVDEAKAKAAKYYDRHFNYWDADLFAEAIGVKGNDNPLQVSLSINLKPPTEKDVMADMAKARSWARSWHELASASSCGSCVQWMIKEWKSVGRQEVPVKIALNSPEEIADFAGCKSQWNNSKKRSLTLAEHWNAEWRERTGLFSTRESLATIEDDLSTAIRKTIPRLSELNNSDWNILLLVIGWLMAHPNINIYVRQLPIRGIDSKWLEQHKGMIEPLYCAMTNRTRFDFLTTPHQFRVRFLDAKLAPDGLSDLSLSPQELSKCSQLPKIVFICENLVSVMTFPDIPDAMVIHGCGYAVGALSQVKWLQDVPVLYWGDLDSNGFAILNQLRQHHPNAVSIMMDTETLEQHRELCVVEEKPNRGFFDHLTKDEHSTLALLLLGEKALRLEQERIEWSYATNSIRAAVNSLQPSY